MWMYVCVYIYIYTHTCVYTYIYIYIYIYTYTYTQHASPPLSKRIPGMRLLVLRRRDLDGLGMMLSYDMSCYAIIVYMLMLGYLDI